MVLVELKFSGQDYEVSNILLSPNERPIEAFYKINFMKNNMNKNCLFSGKDIFQNAFNIQSNDTLIDCLC